MCALGTVLAKRIGLCVRLRRGMPHKVLRAPSAGRGSDLSHAFLVADMPPDEHGAEGTGETEMCSGWCM